jgi:hypothetical protein
VWACETARVKPRATSPRPPAPRCGADTQGKQSHVQGSVAEKGSGVEVGEEKGSGAEKGSGVEVCNGTRNGAVCI